MKVDTSARGYRYMSRHEQASDKNTEWVGVVEHQGEVGALGFTAGRYFLYSSGRRPIELDLAEVRAAMARPEHINPRGRKPGANGPVKPHSVTMDNLTRTRAIELGDGNLSLGIRIAVEYVSTQVHPNQLKLWLKKTEGQG